MVTRSIVGFVLTMSCALTGCNDRGVPGATTSVEVAAAEGAVATMQFKVTGMSCDGCAQGIQATLASLPGVLSAQASFEHGTATVTTTDSSIAPVIVEAIERMNFQAEPIGG